jgi:DNA gyrase subunit A
MVQRTSVRGISRYGRASQGVRVMNIRDDDQVSAVALVAESESEVPLDEGVVEGADGTGVEPLADDASDAVIAVDLDDLDDLAGGDEFDADDLDAERPEAGPEPDDAE